MKVDALQGPLQGPLKGPLAIALSSGLWQWPPIIEMKYYGVYHHSLSNLSKCHQSFLSKQSIYMKVIVLKHGATFISDDFVCIGSGTECGLIVSTFI